jgi:hypothetical protein
MKVRFECYTAELGECGGSFDTPWRRQGQFRRHVANVVGNPHGAAKGFRIGGGQNVGQHLNTAHEGFFQKLAFSGDELVLLDPGCDRTREHLGLAGLGEEAENMSLVDRIDGGAEIGVTGEEHAYGVGYAQTDFAQKLRSVHDRHAHVGDHDGIGPIGLNRGEGAGGPIDDIDLKLGVQNAFVAFEDSGFVVHKQDFVGHLAPGCRAPR